MKNAATGIMKAPIKPKAKSIASLDWSECTDFIETKYKINTGDYANSFGQFREWIKANGETETHCPLGCSENELDRKSVV